MFRITERRKVIKGIVVFLMLLFLGYHFYCHYMVGRFYKYINAGDMENALAQVDKMPNVNMLDICYPLYHLEGILTQYAANEGYPLDYAVYKDVDVSIIEALLKKGADPNKVTALSSPFRYLYYYGRSDRYEKVRLMLQYGADMDAVSLYFPGNFRDGGDMSKEAEFQFISFLWENDIDDIISAQTKYERTVLNDAAATLDTYYLDRLYHNEKRSMDYLLNVKDINGETPLFSAVRNNYYDNCVFLIGEGADVGVKNNDGKTAYDIAAELGYDECAKVLQP